MSEFWQGVCWGAGCMFLFCWVDNIVRELRRQKRLERERNYPALLSAHMQAHADIWAKDEAS